MRTESPEWPSEQRFADSASALRRWTARLGYRLFPALASDALAMEAQRLGPLKPPEFFSRDLREISPTLNEDLLDLYGRSEQVLANQFAFHNASQRLEAHFDWEKAPSAAWRRELHSFDFSLWLAMTYRISQEDRYARHLRYLIAHWIAQNPPGHGTGWDLEPLARRVRNWALGSDLTYPAWRDDPEFLDFYAQSFAMQCVFLARQASKAETLATAVHCARALRAASRCFGATAGEEMAETSRMLLEEYSAAVFEGHSLLTRPTDLLGLAWAWAESLLFSPPSGGTIRPSTPESTRRVLTALESSLAPDGTLPLFGPSARSHSDDLSDLFALAAVHLEEPRWKNLAGKFGILPYMLLGEGGKERFDRMAERRWEARSSAVPEASIYRLSAGESSALVINLRPPQSAEDHQDFLSYELELGGLRVVVDSGAYSQEGETDYFASARGHNVLLVDGQSPRPRPRAPRAGGFQLPAIQGSDETQGQISPPEGMQRICVDDGGFNFLGVQHQRAFYCLGGIGWAVLDWLTGKGVHRVVNLIHFFPTFEIELREHFAIARSRALSISVIPLGASASSGWSPPPMRAARGADAEWPGYYSPDFGLKLESSVLALATGEIQLPWFGGYLIVPGTETLFRALQADAGERSVAFELDCKPYTLTMS